MPSKPTPFGPAQLFCPHGWAYPAEYDGDRDTWRPVDPDTHAWVVHCPCPKCVAYREVQGAFRAGTGLTGATEPGQVVTRENVHTLPPGSTVRCGENRAEWLIHLHDDLWLRIFDCGYCYDRVDRFHHLLPGVLCHMPVERPK